MKMKTLFPMENNQSSPNSPSFTDGFFSNKTNPDDIWGVMVLELKSTLEDNSFSKWVKPIKCLSSSSEQISLCVDDPIFYEELKATVLTHIFTCKNRLGFSDVSLRFFLPDGNELAGDESSLATHCTDSNLLDLKQDFDLSPSDIAAGRNEKKTKGRVSKYDRSELNKNKKKKVDNNDRCRNRSGRTNI